MFFLQLRSLCDGDEDCYGGEDERNCPMTATPQLCEYLCPEGNCIPRAGICDMYKDCNITNMDEISCYCQNKSQWRCPYSHKCISISYICDGTVECPNAEDEMYCPTILPTGIPSTAPNVITTITHITPIEAPTTKLQCVSGHNNYSVSKPHLQAIFLEDFVGNSLILLYCKFDRPK